MKFNRLAVYGVRFSGAAYEVVDDELADFYSLFGFVTAINGGEFAVCVGDYDTRSQGDLVMEALGF